MNSFSSKQTISLLAFSILHPSLPLHHHHHHLPLARGCNCGVAFNRISTPLPFGNPPRYTLRRLSVMLISYASSRMHHRQSTVGLVDVGVACIELHDDLTTAHFRSKSSRSMSKSVKAVTKLFAFSLAM